MIHPEQFRSISVNSVTAADVFQILEISVCVVVATTILSVIVKKYTVCINLVYFEDLKMIL